MHGIHQDFHALKQEVATLLRGMPHSEPTRVMIDVHLRNVERNVRQIEEEEEEEKQITEIETDLLNSLHKTQRLIQRLSECEVLLELKDELDNAVILVESFQKARNPGT